jgi:hypothetical protein
MQTVPNQAIGMGVLVLFLAYGYILFEAVMDDPNPVKEDVAFNMIFKGKSESESGESDKSDDNND